MNIRTACILLTALLCCASAGAQTLYKVVGPDGKIVYSSEKPNVAHTTLRVSAVAGTGPSVPQARKVVLYTATWCGYCAQARAYMGSKGIRFEEIDVETSYGRSAFASATGSPRTPEPNRASGIPYLVAGDMKQRGFSAESYDRIFAQPR